MSDAEPTSFEREKWHAEHALRSRELEMKTQELELKRVEQRRSRWSNPLTVAVFAAAVAATGNAVVATVNGNLGRKLEKEKAESTLKIEESKAESGRIFEMIKTGDPERAATNLRFLADTGLIADATRLEKLNTYLANRNPGSGVALPAAGSIVSFETTPDLTQPIQRALESNLAEYTRYLTGLGLLGGDPKVSVQVSKTEGQPNAYYMGGSTGNVMVIDPSLVSDPDVARREFGHHALLVINPGILGDDWSGRLAMIESGLADYLVASSSNRPKIGAGAAKVFGLAHPYIRNLDNDLKYATIASLRKHESQRGGEIWGGAFWAIRTALGQDVTDRLLIAAWKQSAWFSYELTQDGVASAFARAIMSDADTATKEAVKRVLTARGFPY